MSKFFAVVFAVFLVGIVAQVNNASEATVAPVKLVAASDLYHDAEHAAQQQLPILLYFASDYCGYCRMVEEEQLKPMLRNRDYDRKVILRRVNLTGFDTIIHVDGRALSAEQLAQQYRAGMTPTLVFIDAQGSEIAPRIVGVSSMDFYGGYLDESINTALRKLRTATAMH